MGVFGPDLVLTVMEVIPGPQNAQAGRPGLVISSGCLLEDKGFRSPLTWIWYSIGVVISLAWFLFSVSKELGMLCNGRVSAHSRALTYHWAALRLALVVSRVLPSLLREHPEILMLSGVVCLGIPHCLPGIVVHVCNHSIQEAEAGGLQ